jgi:hypothetical protein
MSARYRDCVEFSDGSDPEEMNRYLQTEHTENWLVWVWSDLTIRIPAHRIKSVTTVEYEE